MLRYGLIDQVQVQSCQYDSAFVSRIIKPYIMDTYKKAYLRLPCEVSRHDAYVRSALQLVTVRNSW